VIECPVPIYRIYHGASLSRMYDC